MVPLRQEIWVVAGMGVGFLRRHGFEPVPRAQFTGPVTRSELCASLCPSAATPLRLMEPALSR
jgi:hypothetical protein